MGILDKLSGKKKNDGGQDNGWLLPEDSRDYVAGLFEKMEEPVDLRLYLRADGNQQYADFCRKFCRDLARLGEKVRLEEIDLDSEAGKESGIAESPTLLLSREPYKLAYTGTPAGEEARVIVDAIAAMSQGRDDLSDTSRHVLDELRDERRVRVFVSPTCPYCPGQVANALAAHMAKPELVSVQVVEIAENQELARRFNVGSVPHTTINEQLDLLGMEQQERFVAEMVFLMTAEELAEKYGGHDHDHEHHHDHGPQVVDRDLVIVGGGPGGLAGAIYAVRAGLRTVVLERKNVGGQVAVTPVVENYPGFLSTPGSKLVEVLAQHARQYVDVLEGVEVGEIKVGRDIEVVTPGTVYRCRAVLLATGATWRFLGVPGEQKFYGRGVSHCAACDAYLYQGRKALVVGGGNTALTDALHLKNLGADVTVVHRRDAFRAQDHLQRSIQREGVPVHWNTVVEEMLGDEELERVRLRNVVSGETWEEETAGLFLAIGEKPNNQLARQLGLKLLDDGSIETDRFGRTSIPRIYAAGDVTGGVRQIVTAIGDGSAAAMTVFEDLKRMESDQDATEATT
ncbi:FAD-dependent oxidoreductase [Desulfohalovibrio reitneri]|uniref:FAD-dependent oxidoreductase n=1 Tax=Desulfohalovibrio reitneri TaxID=1307759 RepID=UPI00068CDD9A|nr:FAD-dependent oxidoreductase [Desulfohalovibrio reitneri]